MNRNFGHSWQHSLAISLFVANSRTAFTPRTLNPVACLSFCLFFVDVDECEQLGVVGCGLSPSNDDWGRKETMHELDEKSRQKIKNSPKRRSINSRVLIRACEYRHITNNHNIMSELTCMFILICIEKAGLQFE